MVSARLNQLLVLMSDSIIGFLNQVDFCPWLKLDESSTRLPGPLSLETTPSLLWQAWSTRNKHYSDQTAKGPWCFLDRRQSDKGSDLPAPFFCYEKRCSWSISENISIVVGTIPLLACIPVLSGKKIYEKTRPSTFFTLRHKLIKEKGNLWAKNVLFETFRSKPVQQASYRPGRSIKFLISDSVCVGHSGRPRACGPRATLVTYTYAIADKELISRPDGR